MLRSVLIVSSRHHGNTLRVAEAMADVLGAEILTPQQGATTDLGQYDLAGFGSGIYFGRPDASLRRYLRTAPELPAAAFLFSTSGLPWLSWVWHLGLRRQLASRGCRLLGEFTCRGWDTVGPLVLIGGLNRRHPDEHDLDRARQFATQMIEVRSHPASARKA